MAQPKGVKRNVRCYLCGHRFEVSARTLSTACPGCFAAIKVEDVVVKTYLPVNDLQTCGKITITRRGRVAARRIQCGDGIVCEGSMEGSVETDGEVTLGAKASWKGKALQSRSLSIADGAKLQGLIVVPWDRGEQESVAVEATTQPEAVADARPAGGAVKKKRSAAASRSRKPPRRRSRG